MLRNFQQNRVLCVVVQMVRNSVCNLLCKSSSDRRDSGYAVFRPFRPLVTGLIRKSRQVVRALSGSRLAARVDGQEPTPDVGFRLLIQG